MPIEQVNAVETAKTVGESAYSGGSPFTAGFKMLTLEEGQTYQLRLLPPNWSEHFGVTKKFAVKQVVHGGVGAQAQEICSCPSASDFVKKTLIKCVACEEQGTKSERSKLKLYFYANCVLLSNNTNPRTGKMIPKKKENGKLIVYTIRMSKTQVYDVIANYYGNAKRAVADLCDLKNGCAITITAVKKAAFKNYSTQILEASKADLTPWIDVDDIKDLRFITEYVPTAYAMKLILGGTAVKDALEVGGKVSTWTGAQVGGYAGAAPATGDVVAAAMVADELPDGLASPDMPMGMPGDGEPAGFDPNASIPGADDFLGGTPGQSIDDLSGISDDPNAPMDLSKL